MSDKHNRREGSGQGNENGSSQTWSKKRRTATNRDQRSLLNSPQTKPPMSDEERVSKTSDRILRGLGKEAVSTAPQITPRPNDQYRTYDEYAAYVFSTAKAWKEVTQNSVWWAKFCAGSISLAGPSLPARAPESAVISKQSCSTIARWRKIAQFSNILVLGLYPLWKEEAFLIPHALAGE